MSFRSVLQHLKAMSFTGSPNENARLKSTTTEPRLSWKEKTAQFQIDLQQAKNQPEGFTHFPEGDFSKEIVEAAWRFESKPAVLPAQTPQHAAEKQTNNLSHGVLRGALVGIVTPVLTLSMDQKNVEKVAALCPSANATVKKSSAGNLRSTLMNYRLWYPTFAGAALYKNIVVFGSQQFYAKQLGIDGPLTYGLAGVTVSLAIAPSQVIKYLMLINKTNLSETLATITLKEFFQKLAVNVRRGPLRDGPFWFTYKEISEQGDKAVSKLLKQTNNEDKATGSVKYATKFLVGAIAGSAATIFSTPGENLRQLGLLDPGVSIYQRVQQARKIGFLPYFFNDMARNQRRAFVAMGTAHVCSEIADNLYQSFVKKP